MKTLDTALAAADPEAAVRRVIHTDSQKAIIGGAEVRWADIDRVLLIPVGKAALPMTRGAEAALGPRLTGGVGVTVPELAGPTKTTTLHRGGHPIPDPGSLMAGRHIARFLQDVTRRDLVLVLLSGGASALLELPAQRIQLADLQSATSALLACGATINEMNTVRKHLSAVKGGQLARMAAPAQLVSLIVSDVVGDPLEVIGSGPTVADPTTFGDAAEVIARYNLWSSLPQSVADHIRAGSDSRVDDTPKPNDPIFSRATTQVISGVNDAVTAAASAAEDQGFDTYVLTTFLEGEAREAGRVFAAIAKEIVSHDRPVARPAAVIAGGETTVTLRRLGGHGGRNQELALAVAVALEGWPGFAFAAMGTDGADGTTEAAGAMVDGSTVARGRDLGLDARADLDRHDSGTFFQRLGDQIMTGPTGTNVNDINVLLAGAT